MRPQTTMRFTLRATLAMALLIPTFTLGANRLRAEWERTEYVVIGYEPTVNSAEGTTGGFTYFDDSRRLFWKTAIDAILASGAKVLIGKTELSLEPGAANEDDFFADLRLMGYVDQSNKPIEGIVIDTGVVNEITGARESVESIWQRDRWGQTVYENEVGYRIQSDFNQDNSRICANLGIKSQMLAVDKKFDYIRRGYLDGGNILSDGMGRLIMDPLGVNDFSVPASVLNAARSEISTKMGVTDFVHSPSLMIHVDYHSKLIDEETMLVSDHFPELKTYWESQNASTGRPYRVVSLAETPVVEMPGLNVSAGSYYANSLIVNNTVLIGNGSMSQRSAPDGTLIPDLLLDNATYDSTAIGIYRNMFPGYKVVMLPQSPLYHSILGSIHCLTNEIGTPNPVYLRGTIQREGDTLAYSSEGYMVTAVAKSAAGIKDVNLWWKKDDGQFNKIVMTAGANSSYEATIPYSETGGEKISYYFEATDNKGVTEMRPFVGANGPFTYQVAAANPTGVKNSMKFVTAANITQTNTSLVAQFGTADSRQIKIFDLRGRMIFERAVSGTSVSIPWSEIGGSQVFVMQIHTSGNRPVQVMKISRSL